MPVPFLERLERARSRPILVDSATGTWFQEAVPGIGGECCERFNLERPDLVRRLYREKVEAGSEIILTNTFNANPLRLREFGLEDRCEAFNEAGVRLLREVIDQADSPCFAGANIGPTGKLIGQTATYEEAVESFRRQARVLVRAGADLICIETMLQALEGQAAVEAVRAVFADEGVALPLYLTFAFMERAPGATVYRTFFGETVGQLLEGNDDLLAERRYDGALALGVAVVGLNCSVGVDDAIGITAEFAAYLRERGLERPLVAAKPNSRVMSTQRYETPELVASRFEALVRAGASLIGYCCGSVPAHIARAAEERRRLFDG